MKNVFKFFAIIFIMLFFSGWFVPEDDFKLANEKYNTEKNFNNTLKRENNILRIRLKQCQKIAKSKITKKDILILQDKMSVLTTQNNELNMTTLRYKKEAKEQREMIFYLKLCLAILFLVTVLVVWLFFQVKDKRDKNKQEKIDCNDKLKKYKEERQQLQNEIVELKKSNDESKQKLQQCQNEKDNQSIDCQKEKAMIEQKYRNQRDEKIEYLENMIKSIR